MGESFYQQVHRLRDGAVTVYRRGDTHQQVYQARLKVPGVTGYIIRSLKTRDLPTALNQAEDLFYELRAEQKLGMDVRIAGNLKFKDLWKRFYAAHETGLSVHRQRLHKFMSEKYFTPSFGDARLNDMPDAFVEQYWDWRINYHNPEEWEDEEDIPSNAARVPAKKTLDMEAGMLWQIFRWSKRIGFVKREPYQGHQGQAHQRGGAPAVLRRSRMEEGLYLPARLGEGGHGFDPGEAGAVGCTVPGRMRCTAISANCCATTFSLWRTPAFGRTKPANYAGGTCG